MTKVICNSVGQCELCIECGASIIHDHDSCEPCPVLKEAKCLPAIKCGRTNMNNDIVWEAWTPSTWENGTYQLGDRLKWWGYNDHFWWNNVIQEEGWGRMKDSKGNIWQLDPHRNIATLIHSINQTENGNKKESR